MFLQDYIDDVQEIVHDITGSSWPLSRVIARINSARRDVARDMHCIRQNVTGIQLLQGKEIYNLVGAVAGVNVVSGGSNYGTGAVVPITISPPPPGGVQALAVGNLVGGSLESVTMTQWGSGYNQPPTVTVGGIGSGAVCTPVVLFQSNPLSTVIGNPLAVTKIGYLWNQQRRQLGYLSFNLFDAWARTWSTTSFQQPPSKFSHHQQQQLIYIQAPPDQVYQSEWDIVFQAAPLLSVTDLDYITEPWNQAVQFGAAAYLQYKHQNLGKVAALSDKYTAFIPHIITTSGSVRIVNPYHPSFARRVSL
jgi:hypothetical protein